MSAPPRWVFTLTQAHGFCRIENLFDASADARGRLRLRMPDRLQHLHDQRRVDLIHRQVPKDRVGIGRKRVPPLLSMLQIPPSRLMAANEAFGHFPEDDGLRGSGLAGRPLLAPMLDWIDAL